MDRSKTLRLNFIMEDLSLFLYEVSKERQATIDDLVCIARMGLFELTVMLSEQQEKRPIRVVPSLEITARNDQLEIRCCADSAALLTKILIQLAMEQDSVCELNGNPIVDRESTEVMIKPQANEQLSNGVHVRLFMITRVFFINLICFFCRLILKLFISKKLIPLINSWQI